MRKQKFDGLRKRFQYLCDIKGESVPEYLENLRDPFSSLESGWDNLPGANIDSQLIDLERRVLEVEEIMNEEQRTPMEIVRISRHPDRISLHDQPQPPAERLTGLRCRESQHPYQSLRAAIGDTPWSASPAPSSVTGSCRQPREKGRNGLPEVLTDNTGEGNVLPQAGGATGSVCLDVRSTSPHTRRSEECHKTYTFCTKTAHR